MPLAKDRTRILLVDPSALFREGLARLLADQPDFEIVAKCRSIEEALKGLAARPVDVVLLSGAVGSGCTEFFERARAAGLRWRVLVVAGTLDSAEAADLVRLGADGFFLAEDPPELLARNIRDLADGHLWPNQRFLQSVVQAVQEGPSVKARKLSRREREVLRCVLEGMVNKEIASRLGITESSVKAAIQQLFEKTGVHSRSGLVRVALEKYQQQLSEAQPSE
jgi:DNA-binding NarL/FixJ family response regulator